MVMNNHMHYMGRCNQLVCERNTGNEVSADVVRLPNLTRAAFEARMSKLCDKHYIPENHDLSARLRELAIALFCEHEADTQLAIYLSNGCNVFFKGE